MGKRGVIILVVVISVVFAVFGFSNNEFREVSQVTGCFDGVCGGDAGNANSFVLVIDPELDSEFKELYSKSKEKEFLLCLEGERKGYFYHLESFFVPSYVEAKDGNAVYSSCKGSSIGTLHNHYNPKNDDYYCQLSTRDIYTFGQGGEEIMGIVCGNKYVFIHKSDLKPMKVRII